MEKNPDTKSLMPLTDPLALPGPLSIIWPIVVFLISSLCPSSIICLGVCDIFVRPTPCGNNVAPYCSHSHSTLPISGKADALSQIRRRKKPTIVVAKPYRRRSSGPHMHTRHERPNTKHPYTLTSPTHWQTKNHSLPFHHSGESLSTQTLHAPNFVFFCNFPSVFRLFGCFPPAPVSSRFVLACSISRQVYSNGLRHRRSHGGRERRQGGASK